MKPLAPATASRSNPALWGYGFGALLIGLGLLVLSIALGSALRSATRGTHRLSLPGSHSLLLKEGLYVGILPAAGKTPPLSGDVWVTITDQSGVPVQQMPFPPELAGANEKIGRSLFQALIPYEDRYTLESRLPPDASPAELLLIHESLSRNSSDIIVGLILMVVLGGFGIYVLIVTWRRGAAFPKTAK